MPIPIGGFIPPIGGGGLPPPMPGGGVAIIPPVLGGGIFLLPIGLIIGMEGGGAATKGTMCRGPMA